MIQFFIELLIISGLIAGYVLLSLAVIALFARYEPEFNGEIDKVYAIVLFVFVLPGAMFAINLLPHIPEHWQQRLGAGMERIANK